MHIVSVHPESSVNKRRSNRAIGQADRKCAQSLQSETHWTMNENRPGVVRKSALNPSANHAGLSAATPGREEFHADPYGHHVRTLP